MTASCSVHSTNKRRGGGISIRMEVTRKSKVDRSTLGSFMCALDNCRLALVVGHSIQMETERETSTGVTKLDSFVCAALRTSRSIHSIIQ